MIVIINYSISFAFIPCSIINIYIILSNIPTKKSKSCAIKIIINKENSLKNGLLNNITKSLDKFKFIFINLKYINKNNTQHTNIKILISFI